MRKSLLAALLLVPATGACVSLLGDFSLGKGSGDSGVDAGDAGEDGAEGGATSVTAVAVASNVYLGQTATLDGTQSTSTPPGEALGYTWVKLMAPQGSGVTTQSLSSTTSSTVTFKPDVLGEYQWKLTVTSGDAPSSTALVTVYCGNPEVFFAEGFAGGSGSPYATYEIADVDGGPAHAIMCNDQALTDTLHGADIPPIAAYTGRAYDFWEAPPLDPSMPVSQDAGSRLAAFTLEYSNSNYTGHLWTATNVSACNDAGVTDMGTNGFGPSKPYGSQPHFRPDGERFAVYDHDWNIWTYAWNDATSVRMVASYPPSSAGQLDPSGALQADGGILQSYFQVPPQVQWLPETDADGGISGWSLAWAVPAGSNWSIMTAPDQANGTPTTYITCQGVVPRQFAFLSDGTIIASYRLGPMDSENLYHLQAVGGSCSVVGKYTSLNTGPGSSATDFSVSPDGATIAFLKIDTSNGAAVMPFQLNGGLLPGGYVFTVPTAVPANQSPTLTQVYGSPVLLGPRWIGGGSMLVFTRLDGVTSTGLKTSVVVVPASNTSGAGSVIAQGDGVSTFVSTSGNAACGIGRGQVAGGAASLIGLVGLAGVLRRRRRAD